MEVKSDIKPLGKIRNTGADALKAYLIFFVIFSHLVNAVLQGFHYPLEAQIVRVLSNYYFMPLFAVVAGYFFASTVRKFASPAGFFSLRSLIVIILNKGSELLLPVVVWNGAYSLIIHFDTLSLRNLPWVLYWGIRYQMWFLVALFVSLSMIAVIQAISRKNATVFIILAVLVAVGVHFVYVPDSYFFSWNYHVPYLFPFAVIGYLMGQTKSTWLLFNRKIHVSASIAYLVLCFYAPADVSHWKTGTCLFSDTYSWQKVAYCCLYRDVLAFAGIVTMVPILRYVWRWLERCVFAPYILLIGRNTLSIYVVQSFVVERWIKSMGLPGNAFVNENLWLVSWVLIPAAAVLITVAIAGTCEVLKKIPYLGTLLFGCKLSDYLPILSK